MKNLKLLNAQQTSTVPADNFCVDIDKKVYISSSKTLYYIEKSSPKAIPCADLISEIEDPKSYITGMEFLFESNSVFIAASSGDLYMYNIDDGEISAVGFVETSIEDFAWSPDQEFLVLLTGAGTLIMMTKEFDAFAEKSLCTDEFGESKPINVGWGSKTTQFHGSEGKEAARIKQKEPQQALPYDDLKSRISWRKDGEYFVTSSVDKSKGYRLLRVWNQAAVLQYTSEVVEGLEEPVCWRPLGNVIACSQQCPNKHQIIFFEKNGLRHGEFTLPFKPNTFKVSTLSWNSDSSILLVVAEEICDNPTDFQVMLWTSSNYHWFLKQKFFLNIFTPYKPLIVKWSSFHPNELQCYNQSTGDFYAFKWAWCIFHGSGNNGCDDSIVASIDNEKLLISPFGKLVVPPPLCGYMFSVTSSIQSVFFAPTIPAFAIYLGNSKLMFFWKGLTSESPEGCSLKLVAAGGNGFKSQVQPYSFLGSSNFKLKNDNALLFGFCHWTWTNYKILCVAFCNRNNQDSKYCILSLEAPSEAAELSAELSGNILTELDSSVVGMTCNASGNIIAVLLDDGRVFQINTDSLKSSSNNEVMTPWLCDNDKPLVLLQTCPNISVISVDGKDFLLGLSEKYNLFCNDHIILSGCTSYYIHEEFLLVTTIDNVLKCFSKKSDLLDTVIKNNALPSEVQSQKVEKGARIVIAPFKTTSVILQMPRGNLETIHPRALVLSAICKYLDNLQFGKAFDVAKRQRIDLNILYDHNPQQFLNHVNQVIDQIDSSSDLNLLIASLKNEDVRATMYPLSFKECSSNNTSALSNKINIICDAVRNILDAKNDNKYYHTLLATYVKKEPSELDQALIRLKAFKDSNDLKSTRDAVDSALNFLLYLVNVHELRNTALGTYDLEIAIMVEQKSQKDPKEFLPFYNALQQMEENYRKFKVDMHLQRYKKALSHISKCDDKFSECLQLIKDHRLYTDALYIFPYYSEQFKAVWNEYGDYLMTKRYFDEAGLVFTRCGMHDKALLAYKDSLNWQKVLSSAIKLDYAENRIIDLCLEMSAKLKSSQRYLDASHLLEHYVKDPEEAIVTLVEGCEWNMAMLMISKYKRDDLAESHFIPTLREHGIYLLSHLSQLFETFSKYTERLKLVRTQKRIKAEEASTIKFEDDLFSDVGSVTDAASSCVESKQSGSIMTRKSSKSRRKQKIKKYRLKEGSADEDLALVAALSEIVTKVDTLKDNFLNTLKAMVHFDFDEGANLLQEKMTKIVSIIESEIPNIWNPLENNPAPEMKFGPDSTVNSITASLQMDKTTAPVVKDPELAAPPWRNIEIALQMFK
ncbi:putative elongator complex protein 1 [Argiope bruennichi]|uniref:putative elongator complex protein 1 n=1 Tax=Argiope bruennichi TaxID=94029 RepID=UPI00249437B2|nr:putative elongator complex protein 1 [Argiope bruennichi]